jgi:hypothetical protein
MELIKDFDLDALARRQTAALQAQGLPAAELKPQVNAPRRCTSPLARPDRGQRQAHFVR